MLAYGGKDNLSRFLAALGDMPGFRDVTALGITRDADGSIEPDELRTSESAINAFRSVRGALHGAGFSVPAAPVEIADGEPKVGVYILPDCKGNGMLEDLCLASIQNDPAFRCLDAFFACAREHSDLYPGNMAKARLHAWLATRRRPDLRLGEAAENGIWDWDHETFGPIKNFLRAL